LPEAGQLQRVNNLRQAIQYAGPFLEAQLLGNHQGKTRFFPAMDTKTHLLRLAEALRQYNINVSPREAGSTNQTINPAQPLTPSLRENLSAQSATATTTAESKNQPAASRVDPNIPAPPTRQTQTLAGMTTNQILELLSQQTEGSLQRTLTQQLQMLTSDSLRQQMVFELPIKHGDDVDVFDMRIHPDQEGHQQQDNEPTRPWTIMMAFNLEGLGPIRAQISLFDDKISTHWWAEQQHTVDLFQQHIQTLQDNLSHVGLDIDKIHCQCGIPKLAGSHDAQEQQTHYSDKNLDEQV